MLLRRQLLTIKHLQQHQKIVTPEGIIAYCEKQLLKMSPSEAKLESIKGRGLVRKRSKRYYEEIIAEYIRNRTLA